MTIRILTAPIRLFIFLLMPLVLASPSLAETLYNKTTNLTESSEEAAAPVKTPITAPGNGLPALDATTIKPIGRESNSTPSSVTLQMAKNVGTNCPGHWDSPNCLSAVSSANLVMAANYAADLKNAGYEAEAEQIKDRCAAATAAREKTFPAYAMKSAFIECANLITDLSGKTGIRPDPSALQLLIAPILCLDNDPRCGTISDQLKRFSAPYP